MLLLSEVTPNELAMIQIARKHKPVVFSTREILRAERLAQKIQLAQLSDRLKEKDINRSYASICRWERGYQSPTIDILNAWAECLNLKMSIIVRVDDRRLAGGDWRNKLRLMRKDKGLFLHTINKNIGVNPFKLTLWEKGLACPDEPELKAWAIAVGATACLVFERV